MVKLNEAIVAVETFAFHKRVELPDAMRLEPAKILTRHVPFWTSPPAVVPKQLLLVRPVNPRLVVVAFVLKALVEETTPVAVTVVPDAPVKLKLPKDETPESEAEAKVRPPTPSTLNLDTELTWRSMKLPTKVDILAPINVPVAFPPAILEGPSWIKALVEVA